MTAKGGNRQMPQQRQIDDLLRQQRFAEASIRMECLAMEGRKLDEARLRNLPEAHLIVSPMLMQALGEVCFRAGKLHEAKRWLESAVNGHGTAADAGGLLAAMCGLAHVLLHLGEIEAAKTLLVFLQEEHERTPDSERSAGLSFALAAGSHLISGESRAKEWYLEAIDRYEQNLHFTEAADVLADLLFYRGQELTSEEMGDLAWRLQRWATLPEETAINTEWIGSLHDARLQQWERAWMRLQTVMLAPWEAETYLHKAKAHLIHFRATFEAHPERAEKLFAGLNELRHQYRADLLLQHAILRALGEGHRRFGRIDAANAALAEAGFIGRHLKLPEYAAPPTPPPAQKPVRETAEETMLPTGWWRVRFFGGLSFERGADEVRQIRWKRRKAQELCVFLLLQPRYSYPKEQLTELLQLGDDPDKANKSLYVIIHQLKQTLFAQLAISDGIVTREGMVALREDAFEYVDVERYLALLRVADQLWLKDRALAYELYQEACMLFDSLLPELPYISWLENQREYLADKQVAVIRKLRKLAEEQEDSALEEMYCQEWIRLRPDQEEAYQQFILLLIRLKRYRESALVYEKYAARCRDELGMEPSEDIRSLLRGSGFEHLS